MHYRETTATTPLKSPSSIARKRVRFSKNINVIPRSDHHTDDVKSSSSSNRTWWSPTDISQFRQNAKLRSREARKKAWMTSSFERSYKRATRVANLLQASHDNDSGPDDHNTNVVDPEAKLEILLQDVVSNQDLVDWCRYGHCKRGLERWSSRIHNQVRSQTIAKVRSAIVELQAYSVGNYTKDESDDKNHHQQWIRSISERLSGPSRVFARLMGQADADAVSGVVDVVSSHHEWQKQPVGSNKLPNPQQQRPLAVDSPSSLPLLPDSSSGGASTNHDNPIAIMSMPEEEMESRQILVTFMSKCSFAPP